MKLYSNDIAVHQLKLSKIRPVLTFLLVFMFSYAAISKFVNFFQFRSAMLVQPFPQWVAEILVYLLPAVEMIAVVLLIGRSTEFLGYWLSLILMVEFTGYVGLVLLHFWNALPCSCGGILGHLSWGPHLLFNLIFLLITIAGLYIKILERREGGRR